jgi:hypothetical protein
MTGVEEVVQLLYGVHHLHLLLLRHNGYLFLIIRLDLQHDTSILAIALRRV